MADGSGRPRNWRSLERIEWLKMALVVCALTQTDECVEWPFSRSRKNYGMVFIAGRTRPTHHVSLELAGRSAPIRPLETRHLCHNPPCFNPRHLLNGTHAENMADSTRAERRPRKLTADQVRQIRRRYISVDHRPYAGLARKLAAEFGVSEWSIYDVVKGRCWNWLDPVDPDDESVCQQATRRAATFQWLARARELRSEGWTYQRIAEELGIKFSTVYGYLNGKTPRFVTDAS